MTYQSGIIKVLLVGDENTGKTSILRRATDNSFDITAKKRSILEFDVIDKGSGTSKHMSLQIWDTAGSSLYWPYGKSLMTSVDVYILVYDRTRFQTFQNLEYWMKMISTNQDYNETMFIVVGGKSDLNDCKVPTDLAKSWAKEKNAKFIECSAKNGLNVSKIFDIIYDNFTSKIIDEVQSPITIKQKLKRMFIGSK